MPQWRKLHTKITQSLDFQEMPDDFTRLVWALLPLGADREGRYLDNASLVKARIMPLREDVGREDIIRALEWFNDHAMIRRYSVNGRNYFYMPTFAQYQGDTRKEAPSVLPPPPNTILGTVPDTVPTPELVQSKSSTDSDSDSDSDVEVEVDIGANAPDATASPPPSIPEPITVKQKDRRTRVTSDVRAKTSAIQCARAVNGGRYPPRELFDDIIRILGPAPDTPRLVQCRKEWVSRGYNSNSWKWLTEWYVGGIPERAIGPRRNETIFEKNQRVIAKYMAEAEAEEHGKQKTDRADVFATDSTVAQGAGIGPDPPCLRDGID